MPKVIHTLSDLTPDQENINQRTRRSYEEINESMEYCGWGRDIVVDRDGNVIAGNGSLEVLMDRFEGQPPEPIVIQTDGKRPLIHQRIDVGLYDEHDERARVLSYMDNATTRHSQWNRDVLAIAVERHRPLERIFTDEELAELLHDRDPIPQGREAKPQSYVVSVRCKNENDMHEVMQRLVQEGLDASASIRRGR